MSRVDVAVIGAGPAGAMAAWLAARAGLSTVLIDKAEFPRSKPCGCCLGPRACRVLGEMGVDLPGTHGAPVLHELRLAAAKARASLPISGLAISRGVLDAALVERAREAGVVFRSSTTARVLADGSLSLRTLDGESRLSAATVVVADGISGTSLAERSDCAPMVREGSPIGLAAIVPGAREHAAGVVFMTIGGGGYVGAVRLEDGSLNIAAALEPAMVRQAGSPSAAVRAVLREAGMPEVRGLDEARFAGTPRLTRSRRRLEWGPVVVIGDAAGYVEPFTGEGMTWAIEDAVAIQPLLRARARGEDTASWRRVRARRTRGSRRVCRAIGGLARWPAVAVAVVRVLSWWPALATPVIRRTQEVPA